MSKAAGSHAQMWCHTPFTHRLCTGYRWELIRDPIGLPNGGTLVGKVEILCSCEHHDLIREERADPERHRQAIQVTRLTMGDDSPALQAEPLTRGQDPRDVLAAYVGLLAGDVADVALAEFARKTRSSLKPSDAAEVFLQLLALYMHEANQSAFSIGEDEARVRFQERFAPYVEAIIVDYLGRAFRQNSDRVSEELSGYWFAQINEAEFYYASLENTSERIASAAYRVESLLDGVSTVAGLVEAEAWRRNPSYLAVLVYAAITVRL